MNFELARPWAFALLPLVPLILWSWRRRTRAAVAWPDAADLVPIAANRIDSWRTALRALVLLATILALAGPRQAIPGERIDAEGIALMLVVDVSGSMAEEDFQQAGQKVRRIDAVKAALDDFISRRPQDRIGLVLFSTLPDSACPLTLDHAALKKTVDSAEPHGVPGENETNIGDAIAWGLERLRADPGRKALIVLSDGEHNVPAPALTPRQAAQLAATAGVPIYAIDASPATGPGRASLESAAPMTKGACFGAHDQESLAKACNEIDRLERSVATGDRARRYREAEQPLALAAFALLALALALDLGPWLRVP